MAGKRTRRRFTAEFKALAVRRVLDRTSKRVLACCWKARSSIAATKPTSRRCATSRKSSCGLLMVRFPCSTALQRDRRMNAPLRDKRRRIRGASHNDNSRAGEARWLICCGSAHLRGARFASRFHESVKNSTRAIKFPHQKQSKEFNRFWGTTAAS